MSHTPGPWKTVKPGHGHKTPYLCVQIGEDDTYTTLELKPDDARLIAAAPTMADALLWIRENLHPQALGRSATDAELYAITHATFALRAAGVIPTPELTESEA